MTSAPARSFGVVNNEPDQQLTRSSIPRDEGVQAFGGYGLQTVDLCRNKRAEAPLLTQPGYGPSGDFRCFFNWVGVRCRFFWHCFHDRETSVLSDCHVAS
ncbi:hypothetical protein F3P66_18845 [Agrobacterium fabrum]|uniref:Uncharacterized protein n=1 Tax=Agrobacterium fabrum (strain C58 / ATCC 33970) TaxID=176299 RepID=Q8U972_AGRFC|nr:hypothetical protein Atu3856 [Agrobacterium fabrum str. C58]QRM62417.1 hypothetical protein F3P66_18845 [Agrobacterium fabrum]TRB27451.1 hypothetical protein EXN51_19660 [Agrobacterium fabrum]